MSLTELTSRVSSTPTTNLDISHLKPDLPKVGEAIINLMNISGVMTSRSTHYNSKEEAEAAMKAAHQLMFGFDRGLYLLIHSLDGSTDFSRQRAVSALLSNSVEKYPKSVLSLGQETDGIKYISGKLPANRQLNLFKDLAISRVNNTRTKKRLILPALLGDADRFCFWAVKYRKKVKAALTHAWDEKTTGIVTSILKKTNFGPGTLANINMTESQILFRNIGRYVSGGPDGDVLQAIFRAYEGVAFVFGDTKRTDFTMPMLKAFNEAKTDLSSGEPLPIEVLEGIRSTYHKKETQAKVLKTASKTMTNKQRMLTQKKAQKEGVHIEFDPMTADIVDLYKMAYETGMTEEVWAAINKKAFDASKQIPIRFNSLGILVDNSYSMIGGDTQKMRPMAIAMSVMMTLKNTADKCRVRLTSSESKLRRMATPMPGGETNIASGLLSLIKEGVDAVFVISDGYENSPAGRTDEVVRALRSVGVETPVYHINPVAGAESKTGLRSLSSLIPTLPLASPKAMGLMLFRAMMEVDVERGIHALIGMTLPLIENGRRRMIR